MSNKKVQISRDGFTQRAIAGHLECLIDTGDKIEPITDGDDACVELAAKKIIPGGKK